jgi:catechol 2,3-dioxygenase-like lactoylglutathione lyase family enzyme
MQLKRVVAFLVTTNPELAERFYRDVLGFTFLVDDGFALVFDAHGTMLRIGKAEQFTPSQNTVLGWETRDIHEAVSELTQRGVAFDRHPQLSSDEHSVHTFPTGDKVAWFKDPDGNVLSISQHHYQYGGES